MLPSGDVKEAEAAVLQRVVQVTPYAPYEWCAPAALKQFCRCAGGYPAADELPRDRVAACRRDCGALERQAVLAADGACLCGEFQRFECSADCARGVPFGLPGAQPVAAARQGGRGRDDCVCAWDLA